MCVSSVISIVGNYTQWPTSFTLCRLDRPETREPSSKSQHWTADRASGNASGRRYGRRLRLVIEREPERLSVTLGKHVGKTLTIGILERLRCPAPVTGVCEPVERGGGAPLRRCRWTVLFQLTHLTGTHTHTHTHAPLCPNTRDRLTFSRASCHPLETIAPILVHTLRQTTEPCVRLLESTRRSVSDD